ncbi:MAG: hypothetical protein V3T77_08985 [Planctomycetota bacterium]
MERGARISLSVNATNVSPHSDIEIPVYGSVCWYNNIPEDGRRIYVTIDRPLGSSSDCSTLLGFENQDGGSKTLQGVRSFECAVMCFHEPGLYTYRVTGTDRPITGRIRVVDRGD